jgi:hypothetical protein
MANTGFRGYLFVDRRHGNKKPGKALFYQEAGVILEDYGFHLFLQEKRAGKTKATEG